MNPQYQLFRKKIVDVLGSMLGGATAPKWIRADDGLGYVVKDDIPSVPRVRAAEFLWLSVARLVALPAPVPEIIVDGLGRELLGTRREGSAVDAAVHQMKLLSGNLTRGGVHLSRIYAFDLFAGNWDRHANNYLVLEDGGGALAVFAIDFSHVAVCPARTPPAQDPLLGNNNATRGLFPQTIGPYGADAPAAIEIVDRLAALPAGEVDAILMEIPNDWLAQPDKAAVASWWGGQARADRADNLRRGLQNGTLI